MKTTIYTLLAGLLFTAFANPIYADSFADAVLDSENCRAVFDQGVGYTTFVNAVTDNGNDSYTIQVTVENDGCSSWFCKPLDYFALEATAGTYSNVSVQAVSGSFSYEDIDLGPSISGVDFEGFKINGIDGIGGGQEGSFVVTYTLSGGLQNQTIHNQAGFFDLVDQFKISDFQFVSDCGGEQQLIVPYYDPLGVGRVNDLIGYELRAVYFSNEEGTLVPEEVEDIYQIVGNSVLISLFIQPGQYETALSELTSAPYNLTDAVGDPILNTITGLYPIENLLLLNERDDILISASPVFPPLSNAGLVLSQGDSALRANRAREVFDVNGSGIKIGVLSDSYNTQLGDQASDDIIKGDLPGPANPDFTTPVDVLLEYPFGEASDEGRAMLQIVHDVAPGAELAFRTAFVGATDFAQGIIDLKDAGCDVIVDDVTYISEPFFRDGAIAQAVDQVTAEGVSYFSAAGNFGTNSWENTFDGVPAPEGLEGEAHNFAPNGSPVDISQNVTLAAGQYTIVLQWDDGTPGLTTSSDFDIYLASNQDIAFFGFNRDNLGGFPIEVLPFTVLADGVQTNIQIIRTALADGFDGSTPTTLKYVVFRGSLEINEYDELNSSTITGQANAAGAMAVGAVLYTNTPEYGEPNPTVASFSSRGGTLVDGLDRQKPEFCAPNVVNTSVDLGGGFDFEGDGFPNFIGTSAAAPHAAAVAALVLEARSKYYDDTYTPAELKAVLQNSALDMYGPGYDVESGAGYLLADSAIGDIANPSAFLITLSFDTTLTPGIDSIPIIISGEYIEPGFQVIFNGDTLDAPTQLEGDTAITTVIPPYDGDILYPGIQVDNPSQEGTNGLDGGISNTVYFSTQTAIFVDIKDTVKTYGEQIPEFTADYYVSTLAGNLPIESADLTPEELDRIYAIDLTTIANSLSNVGLWGIEPDPNDPLTPGSDVEATDPMDISLLERFNFSFSTGLMTVVPLDIVIDPRDTTLVYNDTLIGFDFDYLINLNDSLNISESDAESIVNAVRLIHGAPLVNRRAVLIQGAPLVNEAGEDLLTADLLENTSFMISSAYSLIQGAALVNGEAIDPELLLEATATTNASRLIQGAALVNGRQLIQGAALVNQFDEDGNIVNSFPLTQGAALVNNSGDLSSGTFNANSNSETLVILGEGDIAILSGDSVGTVELESVSVVTGDNVGNHEILAGAFLSNNFNVSYLVGGLTIIPDTVSLNIDSESLVQQFDGTAKEVEVTAVPDTVEFTVTYNGSSEPPTNAGSYDIEVLPVDSNYFGSASATLTITSAFAIISIDPSTLNQEFDGNPKEIIASTSPEGIPIEITYDGSMELPVLAGSYDVLISILDPNYVGSATAVLVIEPGSVDITISGLEYEYDGSARAAIVTIDPVELEADITYDGSEELPVDAGDYEVDVIVFDDNYMGSSTALLQISQREVIVNTGINWIDQGSQLPEFDAEFEGFINDDDESVFSELYFDLGPEYTGQPGVYPVIPGGVTTNYTLVPGDGVLYVNPAGPGTKLIIPKFECYEILQTSGTNGFDYLAHFYYINNNATDVYIPKGNDNKLIGADCDDTNLPEVFLAGGGSFTIPFDGTTLKWKLRSNHKSGSKKTRRAMTWFNICEEGSKNTDKDRSQASEIETLLFPNPSSGKVYVQITGEKVKVNTIEVFDNYGRKASIPSPIKNDHIIEIDLTSQSPGLYLIKISGDRWSEVLNVVKE